MCNFTPVDRKKYVIGVPEPGEYAVEIDSSWEKFGGNKKKRSAKYKAENKAFRDYPYSLSIDSGGLSVMYIRKK